jgi:hypothetical protein
MKLKVKGELTFVQEEWELSEEQAAQPAYP